MAPTAGILTWAGQHEFESTFPELIDYPTQGFQHGTRSARQAIVQQNNVPAYRFVQDAAGKNAGIFSKCVKGPNTPRNIFQPDCLKIGRQKRVAQTDR